MHKKLLLFAALFMCAVAPTAVSATMRSLTLGMSGSDVTALQQALIVQGDLPAGKASGYFGPLTLAAVEKFQCDKGVICSGAAYGIAGPRTQAALAGQALAGSSGGVASTPPPTTGGVITGTLTPKATGAFETSGWIPYWRSATGTQDVIPHLSQLTSVMPFGYTVKADGTLFDALNIGGPIWQNFIALAHQNKVRVVPTVMWGNGTAQQAILSNATTRIALEDEIASVVQANGFDGIDIDFEAKQSQTINYFSTFLRGLYARMGQKWVYCTVEARMPLVDRFSPGATIPPDATEYANDYAQMNKYCDRVEIMAYDQTTVDVRLNTARSAPYAPVADPGWVEDIVTLAAQTISRNKLIIGIPTYGYEYSVTPVPGQGNQYDVLWPFNLRYATDIAAQLGITPHRTSANEMGFIYNPSTLAAIAPTGESSTQTQQTTPSTTVAQNLGSQVDTSQPYNYVTWSDAQAIADKVALAKKLGVRGVAVFKFDGGEDQGMWSVLK